MINLEKTTQSELKSTIRDTFKKEWDEKELQSAKKSIVKYLGSRYFESHHSEGKYCFLNCRTFSQFDNVLGMAYTSSSSYAGLFVCNTELYLDIDRKYKLDGFALGNGGFVYAVWSDSDENEVIFPIN